MASQHERAVAHGARHRARLIERGRERDDAPARAAAIGRLHADDAAESGRLADRAAGIGAGRGEAQTGGHRRRRAARAAAGHQIPVELSRRPVHGLDRPARSSWSSLDEPMANSSMLVLPSITAPASHRFCGDGGFVGRDEAVEDVRPAVVRTPLVQNRSLIASGRPSSGRASPRAMRRSARAAICARLLGCPVMKALSERACSIAADARRSARPPRSPGLARPPLGLRQCQRPGSLIIRRPSVRRSRLLTARRIARGPGPSAAVADRVGAPGRPDVHDRPHRLDIGRVDLVELGDPIEDVRRARAPWRSPARARPESGRASRSARPWPHRATWVVTS